MATYEEEALAKKEELIGCDINIIAIDEDLASVKTGWVCITS